MEFEEMKSLWTDMSQEVDRQKILTDKLITDMTQERYTNKFSKIFLYESLGAVICFATAIFLLINIQKLDTWYLLTCGIICLSLLLLLPIMSLRSLNTARSLNISGKSFKDTLIDFYRSKKKVLFTQRLSMYLSVVFAIAILPVFSKIINNKDLFAPEHRGNLWIFIPILLFFLFVFSAWVYRSYKKVTTSAESILKELDK